MSLIAKGQVSVYTQEDSYSIIQSVGEYIFSADSNGVINNTISFTSTIKVTQGGKNLTNFTIGTISKPAGFTSILVNNDSKSITYSVTANTTTLAANGNIIIPVIISGQTYSLSFSYARVNSGKQGDKGNPGTDANLLDWVNDWNTNKSVIGSESLITPKIFAGVKNTNNTITGIALGKFPLSTINQSGNVVTENVNGIYGFKDGKKTFFIDATGTTQLGNDNQFIKYNPSTGKVEFGSDVSLNWVGATYIDRDGIFTGTLSATTVNTLRLNASQINAGTIDAARINVAALKAELITAANINALTLAVVQGTIGGWTIDSDTIFRGSKNNTSGAYSAASGAISIGSNGIRGFKWRLDSSGAGAVAGGNISWDAAGNVTFGSSVTLNWNTPITNIVTALGGTNYPKLTLISGTGIYTGSLNASQITAGTISTDRIAAGSIVSSKLDANSIKADIINTAYINGLSCTFIQGKIGGWSIGSDTITIGAIGTAGAIPMQLRSTSSGSGLWYNGAYKPLGLSMLWYQSNNAGHIVFGQVAASGSTVKTGFIGLQMMAWDNTEYFCLSARHDLSGSKEVYNRIAGWAFDNTRIWKNNVSLSADGSIVNGTVWKLNNDGSGQLANGNISWNAAGTVTFGASVSLNWTNAVNTAKAELQTSINNVKSVADNTLAALGGTAYPKLTQISGTGIYTGSLVATQITSGTISADRIAAGSINSSKLDANSIKSDIINTFYINGLSCSFVQGKIGGWTIGTDNITIGSVGAAGAIPIQIRSAASGSGYWYTGAYKPYGIAITWHQNSNAGHIVFGQVAASGNTVKTGFAGIQMMAWDNTEYFCLSARYDLSGSKEVYNRIAGWAFDNTRIWKNNVSLSADGSITNGNLWQINNNGSGRLANGNIIWDASGNVTFGSSVSLNWTNAANNALNSAKSYADTKKAEAVNAAAADATNKTDTAKELAQAMAFGRMLYRDPTFYNGNNSINVYNNSNNGTVAISRTNDNNAPNDSKQILIIKNTGASSPNCGGFYFGTQTAYRKIFITRIIAKIPSGRDISYHSNSIGTGGTQKWLTSTAGTGDWVEYICKVSCGTANLSTTHYFAITGSVGIAAAPVEWSIAYATVFDVTSTEKYTTTIDVNGIYTGTIRANQVLVDSALVVGGSSYNGSISVRDAANAVKVTLDRNGINAVGGIIAGWTIASNQISKNSVILGSDGSIVNGTKWKLMNDGSGQVADGNVSWTAAGAVSITGTINATSGIIGGFSISGNRLINTATNSSIEFLTLTGSSSVSINASTSTLLSMRADSARTALSIQTYASGAKGIYIIANAGSAYAIESYGPHQFGQRYGETWNAPGVLFSAVVKNNTTLYNTWGDGLTVTAFTKLQTGEYRLSHNLGHTQYMVVTNPYYEGTSQHMNCFVRVEYITTSSVRFRVVNADNGGLVETSFTFAIIGRNKW